VEEEEQRPRPWGSKGERYRARGRGLRRRIGTRGGGSDRPISLALPRLAGGATDISGGGGNGRGIVCDGDDMWGPQVRWSRASVTCRVAAGGVRPFL
jgi:hypothetical protein